MLWSDGLEHPELESLATYINSASYERLDTEIFKLRHENKKLRKILKGEQISLKFNGDSLEMSDFSSSVRKEVKYRTAGAK